MPWTYQISVEGDLLNYSPLFPVPDGYWLCEWSCERKKENEKQRRSRRHLRNTRKHAVSDSHTPTFDSTNPVVWCHLMGHFARKISEAATHVPAGRHPGARRNLPFACFQVPAHASASIRTSQWLVVPVPFSRHCFNSKQSHEPSWAQSLKPWESSTARCSCSWSLPSLSKTFGCWTFVVNHVGELLGELAAELLPSHLALN